MNEQTKKKAVTVASVAATGIALYLSYRGFKKQKGALEGLFDSVAKSVTKKRR